jgi:monoamine oxidase
MKDHYDVAVIGAGAAGLAAALRLKHVALEVVVLEARDRMGGRAWTLQPSADLPLDAGCGWLHSANENPLTSLLEASGRVIDRSPPSWRRQSGNQGFAPGEQRAFAEAYDAFESRVLAAAETGVDRPASDLLEPESRWNGLINAISAYYNGAECDQVSVVDYAAYEDTHVNWRARDGYGAGIAALAASVEPVLDCAVAVIDHSGDAVRLTTTKGMLSARAVIITTPTPSLAEEKIEFRPPLPRKIEAATGLPLGLADKAFLHLAQPEALPVDGHLSGHIDRTETGSYHLRPFGRPYIEVFVGGRHARTLEQEGRGAITAFAVEELTELLGSNFRRVLTPITETHWARDPWALGSYSHALPGRAADRAILAEPVESRLFFAGEATHPHFFSTAHGAWQSGARAAEEVAVALIARPTRDERR